MNEQRWELIGVVIKNKFFVLSDSDGRSENMPMTLNELSVYMKEQEQMRIEKEREDGKITS